MMAKSRTPAQRAALRKAQAASARKRRGRGKGKLAAANRKNTVSRRRKIIGYGLYYGGLAAVAYGSHRHTQKVKRDIKKIRSNSDQDVRRILR